MKLTELWNKLDLLQQRRSFKQIASAVVVLLAVAILGTIVVMANSPGAIDVVQERIAARSERFAAQVLRPNPFEQYQATFDDILVMASEGSGIASLAAGTALIVACACVVIWLGVGITYLGLAAIALLVGFPLTLIQATKTIGAIILGLTPLTLLFVSLMQLLRLCLSPGLPILAVARNVLAEAVRMKISLVFIVMVLLLLSLVPQLQAENQQLRYRIQQWMQYGTGLPYIMLALLTVFLSAATVTFEQRDRIIWQTMTKPIRASSYLFGKWLGVMGLNLVMIVVVGAGTFLFTEYLRRQPASDEIAYMVRADGVATRGRPDLMTVDRWLLETQVLVARKGVTAVPYALSPERIEEFEKAIDELAEQRIERIRLETPEMIIDQNVRKRILEEVDQEVLSQLRTIPRGGYRQFYVSGLGPLYQKLVKEMEAIEPLLEERADRLMREAGVEVTRDLTSPERLRFIDMAIGELTNEGIRPNRPAMTLRYKVHSGSDMPGVIYILYFNINGQEFRREVALGQMQSVEIEADLIGLSPDQDTLHITVYNSPDSPYSVSIPPDGLEVLMPAGSYVLNFLRVLAVMWLKLGFLAAMTIAASTVVSFPVACLMAFVMLFAAETSVGLAEALDFYYKPGHPRYEWWRAPFYYLGLPITWTFKWYAELKPTDSLVSGRILPWIALGKGTLFLVFWSLVALVIGVNVFKRRELALYSGH
jgi:ABC-type transport system involved in multi-copper enzyme maturation permease subunit